jgi:transcriptional regulator GlxA family with amidase domain
MEYLLSWRLALAKQLLRERKLGLDQVAQKVGYGSASKVPCRFTRHGQR